MRLNKFYISPLCPIFVIFLLFFNLFDEALVLFILCFIHETGHALVGLLFKCKIKTISLNVFGFSLDIEGIEYKKFYQQILFFLAGPLTYFISLLFLLILRNFNVINDYHYNLFLNDNLSLALFNLLPIYPLDGGHILDSVNRLFFPVKDCYKKRKIYNVICFIPTLFLLIKSNQIILIIILVIFLLLTLFSFDNYSYYLNKRLFIDLNYSKKVSFNNELFHYKNNYYLINGELINEKEMIPLFLLKENSLKKKC